jgi:hypothetical protein
MAAKNDLAALTKAAGDAYEAYAQAQAKLDNAIAAATSSEAAVEIAAEEPAAAAE